MEIREVSCRYIICMHIYIVYMHAYSISTYVYMYRFVYRYTLGGSPANPVSRLARDDVQASSQNTRSPIKLVLVEALALESGVVTSKLVCG